MLVAGDIEAYLCTLNEAGRLNEEEGFLFGGPDDKVTGICTVWMATAPALEFAAANGCNLIISHEAVTFRDYPVWAHKVKSDAPWGVDEKRLALIREHGITIHRMHSTVDVSHVGPVLWESLRLPKPVFSGWVFSHHTMAPMTVTELAARMREGLPLSHVRVTGDPDRIVTEIGTCWGGGGVDRNMCVWIENLLPRGIEALIVGETNDFTQRVAMEEGIALLEGGHSPTEEPGLKRFSADLAKQFPEIKVIHRPQEVPWVTL